MIYVDQLEMPFMLAHLCAYLHGYMLQNTLFWICFSLFSCAKVILCFSIAAGCWTFHYAKRLFETQFVHRFSHGTMPLFNLFKNCTYYWGFTAYVAYHINHPLFTPPCDMQVYMALAAFLVSIREKL